MLLCAIAVGCGGSTPTGDNNSGIASVTLDRDTLTLFGGDRDVPVVATVRTASGTEVAQAPVTWSVDDSSRVHILPGSAPNIALLSAALSGATNVTATSGGRSASVRVTVLPALEIVPPYPNIIRDSTAQLSTTGGPSGARTWSSSTPAIATVDAQTGLVHAISDGKTEIAVQASGRSASTTVTVIDPPPQPVLAVSLSGSGDGTITSNPAGIDCVALGGTRASACSASFPKGTAVTLTATANASTKSTFGGWTATGCTGNGLPTCQVNVGDLSTVGAEFDAPPPVIALSATAATMQATANGPLPSPVAVAISNTGGGTLNSFYTSSTVPLFGASYIVGDTLYVVPTTTQLTPGTYRGQVAVNAYVSGVAPKSVDVTYVVSAPPMLSLTIQGAGSGNGVVTFSPGNTTCSIVAGQGTCVLSVPEYSQDTVITGSDFTDPLQPYVFMGFSGNTCVATVLCNFIMDEPRTIIATYQPTSVSLTLSGALTGTYTGIAYSRTRTLADQRSQTCLHLETQRAAPTDSAPLALLICNPATAWNGGYYEFIQLDPNRTPDPINAPPPDGAFYAVFHSMSSDSTYAGGFLSESGTFTPDMTSNLARLSGSFHLVARAWSGSPLVPGPSLDIVGTFNAAR